MMTHDGVSHRHVICVVNCHQAGLPKAQTYPIEANNSGEPTNRTYFLDRVE
jgi:hypothetical protein